MRHSVKILWLLSMTFAPVNRSLVWAKDTFLDHFARGTTCMEADFAFGSPSVTSWNGSLPTTAIGQAGFGNCLEYPNGADSSYAVRMYLASGNLNLAQATVELWWCPSFTCDTSADPAVASLVFLPSASGSSPLQGLPNNLQIYYAGGGPGGGIYFQFRKADNTAHYAYVLLSVTAGQWYHIAATWGGGSSRVFVNGTASSVVAAVPETTGYGQYIMVGNQITTPPSVLRPAGGKIDELRVSDTVLYTGNFTPPTAPFVPSSAGAGNYTLSQGIYSIEINGANGSVNCGSVRGTTCLTGVIDRYTVTFYSPDTPGTTSIDESTDVVFRMDALGSQVNVYCVNNGLPSIQIIKQYTLGSDGVLSKTVQLVSERANSFFLKTSSKSLLPSALQSGRYYFQLRAIHREYSDGYALSRPADYAWGPADYSYTVVAFNPTENLAVGQYVYRHNGQYVYAPYHDYGWIYTDRWELTNGYEDFIPSASFSRSYEIHVSLCDQGDPLAFYQKYQTLAGYTAMRQDQTDPAWLDRVLVANDCAFMDYYTSTGSFEKIRKIQRHMNALLDSTMDQYITNVAFSWAMYPGYAPWTGNIDIGPAQGLNGSGFPIAAGGTHPASFIRDGVLAARESGPKLRQSLYYWRQSFDRRVGPFINHPDWIAYDESGQPRHGSFNEGVSFDDYLPNLNNSAYNDVQASQVYRMADGYYTTDFLYLDGGNEMAGYADWNTKTFIHGYQFLANSRAMRLHAPSPPSNESAIFMNAPDAPYGSMYYWEGCSDWDKHNRDDSVVIDNITHVKPWRTLGHRMVVAKLMQYGDRWIAPLGWGGYYDGNLQQLVLPADPYYTNYLVGLGLKPARPGDPPLAMMRYPYMQAAYEMRHLRIHDAKYSPCLWRGDNTNVEAYLVGQDSFVAVSLILRESAGRSASVQIPSLGDLNLPGTGPTFLWRIDLNDSRDLPLATYLQLAGLFNADNISGYAAVPGWRDRPVAQMTYLGNVEGTAVNISVPLRPHVLSMLILTRTPGFFYALGDHKVQMNTPSVVDGVLGGFVNGTTASLTVSFSRPVTNGQGQDLGARLALVSPAGSGIREAQVNGTAQALSWVTVGTSIYPVVEVPTAQTSSVTVHYATRPAGDCDGDAAVTSSDLAMVLSGLDMSEGMAGYNPQADLNTDHTINTADLTIVLTTLDQNGV